MLTRAARGCIVNAFSVDYVRNALGMYGTVMNPKGILQVPVPGPAARAAGFVPAV